MFLFEAQMLKGSEIKDSLTELVLSYSEEGWNFNDGNTWILAARYNSYKKLQGWKGHD